MGSQREDDHSTLDCWRKTMRRWGGERRFLTITLISSGVDPASPSLALRMRPGVGV
jgi:hypothetical protein